MKQERLRTEDELIKDGFRKCIYVDGIWIKRFTLDEAKELGSDRTMIKEIIFCGKTKTREYQYTFTFEEFNSCKKLINLTSYVHSLTGVRRKVKDVFYDWLVEILKLDIDEYERATREAKKKDNK